jgi:hypothetical protein
MEAPDRGAGDPLEPDPGTPGNEPQGDPLGPDDAQRQAGGAGDDEGEGLTDKLRDAANKVKDAINPDDDNEDQPRP